ncbi:MAG: hypothetical protein N4A54_08260 [Peptostreptococcaceae bacterium]|jgi:hypothetical protein|nr:hypothetical protein [Peptostreptococcaceae bacterium]
MREIIIEGKKNIIKSSFIKEKINLISEVQIVNDISSKNKDGLMFFDCKVKDILSIKDDLGEDDIEQMQDEDDLEIVAIDSFNLNQISIYLKHLMELTLMDMLEDFLELDIKTYLEIYDFNHDFSQMKFVIGIAFDDISILKLRSYINDYTKVLSAV